MENGIYEGASNQASVPSLKPSDFIAGFVKGKPGNHYRFAPSCLLPPVPGVPFRCNFLTLHGAR